MLKAQKTKRTSAKFS